MSRVERLLATDACHCHLCVLLTAAPVGGSGDMNEATRRLLGVLLRQMDGFASANNRSVVIGATNRRQARRQWHGLIHDLLRVSKT